jgi:sulfur carrier protein
MKVIINGMEEEVSPGDTVAQLIVRFGEADPNLIVELNGRFLFPDKYENMVVREGDRLEFIHPAFGG